MPPFLFEYTAWNAWRDWLDDHALRLLVILALIVLAEVVFRKFVSRVFSRALTRAARARFEDPMELRRRANTLSATLNWAFGLLLMFIAIGLLLSEFGLNVAALIAAAGIAGIAIGLGAQTLVRDVLNGLFILIEDQYAVGDTVTVANVTGEVVEINPRRTVLRDAEGNVHSVPNSSIVVATNRTAGLNRFVVEVEVPFREAEAAIEAIEGVGKELAAERPGDVIAPPRVVDVRASGEGDVRIRIVGDARNGSRWTAEAEFRRRLKRRCDTDRLELRFTTSEPAT